MTINLIGSADSSGKCFNAVEMHKAKPGYGGWEKKPGGWEGVVYTKQTMDLTRFFNASLFQAEQESPQSVYYIYPPGMPAQVAAQFGKLVTGFLSGLNLPNRFQARFAQQTMTFDENGRSFLPEHCSTDKKSVGCGSAIDYVFHFKGKCYFAAFYFDMKRCAVDYKLLQLPEMYDEPMGDSTLASVVRADASKDKTVDSGSIEWADQSEAVIFERLQTWLRKQIGV